MKLGENFGKKAWEIVWNYNRFFLTSSSRHNLDISKDVMNIGRNSIILADCLIVCAFISKTLTS